MYQSKEKLLESVDETESILSTYRSRLQGIQNRSFDLGTEESENSKDHLKETRIVVENVEVHRRKGETSSKPVPLPRSRIPRYQKDINPKELNEVEKGYSSVDYKTSSKTSESNNGVSLATFGNNNERKNARTRKPKRPIVESSIETSPEDLTSNHESREFVQEKIKSANAEQKLKKRPRKQKFDRSKSRSSEDLIGNEDSSIGIYVHDLDYLKFTLDLEAVYIRISIYNILTEELLSRKKRKSVDHQELVPMSTKSCRFECSPNLSCIWEQLLVIEETPKLLRDGNSIIFFEILVRLESSIDLKPISWAFLRPFENGKFDNFEKRLKLQVYQFHGKKTLFENWKLVKKYQKVPSVLSITLKSLDKTKTELINCHPGESKESENPLDISGIMNCKSFRLPNKIESTLKLPGKGTNLLKLNPGGTLVAISNPSNDCGCPIIICNVPGLMVVQKLEGHTGFIYDLTWKSTGNDTFPQTLLSCSADQTVVIWTIERDFSYSLQVIPHVTFVYSCEFWTQNQHNFIVSAGKDSIIRVWKPFKGSFKNHQEFSKGPGFITKIIVTKKNTMYSGSSEGKVIEWKWTNEAFEFSRIILDGRHSIGHLEMHPRIEKIFIGDRRGEIICIDLETLIVIQRFATEIDTKPRRFSDFRISNCGMYLFAISGGKSIQCWNILTGQETPELNCFRGLSGDISSIDCSKRGSFVIIGQYLTNDRAVILTTNTEMCPFDPPSSLKVVENTKTTAVKNKLQDIIEKLDQVLILPQLCDDEKVTLSKEMVNEKRRIEEWLDRNDDAKGEQESPTKLKVESDDGGTFTVERQESFHSNGTFVVKKDDTFEVDEGSSEDDLNSRSLQRGGTFEIKKKKDPDADDTSISEAL